MKLATLGYAKLTARIDECGKDNVVADIVTRMAEGDQPQEIARSYGIPYICLKGFLEENAVDYVGLAKRAHADVLVAQALRHVEDAQIEDVAVARLKAETKLKIAGKQSMEWGDKGMTNGGGFGGITIVIGDVVPPTRAIEGEVGEAIG